MNEKLILEKLDRMEKDIKDIKKHILELDEILADEDFELSDYAKKALKEARNTPEEEYSTLE